MPSIGALVIGLDQNRVLLTLRSDVPAWVVPGGGVELPESFEQAAVREAREETGFIVELIRLVGVYSRPNWRAGGDYQIVFEARMVGGEITKNDEVIRTEFFAVDALPHDLVPWQRTYITDALARRAGHEVWVRTFQARWPFDDQDDPRRAIERLVQGGRSLADAQRHFAKVFASWEEGAYGHS
jgi:8-oxo-dGTP pyrophosphatase MutT (NUDIX family)